MNSVDRLGPFEGLVSNVLRVYDQTDFEVRLLGASWYPAAHEEAHLMCPGNTSRAAGVIAALSPMRSWEHNLKMARKALLIGRSLEHTPAHNEKANAILQGANPRDVLRGPKTRAFYELILDPEAPFVCVDRHAIYVATQGREVEVSTRAVYEQVALAYREAALHRDIWPSEMQATTWIEHKRLREGRT